MLFNQKSLQNFQELIEIIKKNGFDYQLLLIVLLGFVNHTLEATKWKYAVSKIQPVTWYDSFHAVFSGIAIGSITPNSLGDFGGKVLKLNSNNKVKGVLVNFVCNSAQLLSTLIFGASALIIVIGNYYPDFPYIMIWKYILIPAFIISMILLYFSIKYIAKVIRKFSILQKIHDYVDVLSLYKPYELFWILLLAITKYLVFSIQYILAIQYILPELFVSDIFISTALIFLTQSIVPSFAITELFVRTSVSAYFFSFITNDILIIVLAAFSIWILNVILPALIGSVLVLKSKIISENN